MNKELMEKDIYIVCEKVSNGDLTPNNKKEWNFFFEEILQKKENVGLVYKRDLGKGSGARVFGDRIVLEEFLDLDGNSVLLYANRTVLVSGGWLNGISSWFSDLAEPWEVIVNKLKNSVREMGYIAEL